MEEKKREKQPELKRAGTNWTKNEEIYLEDYWGTKSIKSLAKKLGRTEEAIIQKARKLGCGAFQEAGDYITSNQIFLAIYGYSDGHLRQKLVHKYKMPVRTKIINTRRVKVINIDDFWEWAEENKSVLDFSNMEPLCLGKEPEWVAAKRRSDKERKWKLQKNWNEPWSAYNDNRLRMMLKEQKYTYTQISEKLKRSEGAVKRRIMELGIKERPVKNQARKWTEEETAALIDMIDAGLTWETIAEKLGRGTMAVRGKYERLLNPNYMKRQNRGHSKNFDYVGIRDVSPAELKEDMAARDNDFIDVQPGREMII